MTVESAVTRIVLSGIPPGEYDDLPFDERSMGGIDWKEVGLVAFVSPRIGPDGAQAAQEAQGPTMEVHLTLPPFEWGQLGWPEGGATTVRWKWQTVAGVKFVVFRAPRAAGSL